jgi:hypothetical protein
LGKSLPDSILDDILLLEDPIQRAKLKIELMPYIYPRRKAAEISIEGDNKEADQAEIDELVRWLGDLEKDNKAEKISNET